MMDRVISYIENFYVQKWVGPAFSDDEMESDSPCWQQATYLFRYQSDAVRYVGECIREGSQDNYRIVRAVEMRTLALIDNPVGYSELPHTMKRK